MDDMDDGLPLAAKPKILKDTDALQLLIKGKDEWNSWVSDNQDALIDFSNTDFSNVYSGVVSFESYIFPKAGVLFSNVYFGSSGVCFRNAHFNGPASFEDARFVSSSVDFNNVVFENNVSFMNATFTECVIDFGQARFNGQDVSFQDFNVRYSLITFNRAIFDCVDLCFSDAKFSGEMADFSTAQFDGDIIDFGGSEFQSSANFEGVIFNVKEVSFFEVVFEKEGSFNDAIFNCDLSFVNSKFQGDVEFLRAKFANRFYDFNRCLFKHHLDFSQVKGVSQTKSISFKNAIFESSFDISNIKLGCVVDLTGTKFTNQVSIAGLECSIQRTRSFFSKYKLDSERLRRLKDISKTNNDHIGALRFHADEMRAKRWHYGLAGKSYMDTIGVSIIDTIYDWSSEYGQSISKPILWLLLLVSIFTTKYAELAQKASAFSDVSNLAIFSLGNSLPFIPISKLAREAKINELFGSTPPELYDLMMFQGGLSFIFIFLIGLGLRNRFRI